jgi:N-acetylmuramoyl-L-alanine amidase
MPPHQPRPLSRRALLLRAAATAASTLPACRKKPPPPPAPPPWFLTPLAPPPDWSSLDPFQESLTRDAFTQLLDSTLTATPGSWFTHIQITDSAALIRQASRDASSPPYTLRFASSPSSALPKPDSRFWRKASELPPLSNPAKPLADLRIAIDPGHIGGPWARMEERWYRMGDASPVQEGNLTLATANALRPILESMGAQVDLVRSSNDPLTPLRPPDLIESARLSLQQDGTAITDRSLRRESERLFYRTAEIRERGRRVNAILKPDLVLCLHFNADSWGGDPANPRFSTANHLHVLAHGCLLPGELTLDDQRLESLKRIIQGIPETELALCNAVARRMAEATSLPAYRYPGNSARPVADNPFVWIRNLLANRVYECPVVFLEPYVMNNADVFARIQAGDYENTREVAGITRPSIFREYATGTAAGLADYFRAARPSI